MLPFLMYVPFKRISNHVKYFEDSGFALPMVPVVTENIVCTPPATPLCKYLFLEPATWSILP